MNPFENDMIRNLYRQILCKNTCIFVPFYCEKNACLNYREFDLEGDLVGVPHTWYLSAQSFITLLKLVWGEYEIVAMNEWKKKCVGLQRTWVSKRTVCKTVRVCRIQINQIWIMVYLQNLVNLHRITTQTNKWSYAKTIISLIVPISRKKS